MVIKFSLNRAEYGEFLELTYRRMSNIGNGAKKLFAINLVVWIFIGMGFAGVFHFYERYSDLDFMHLNYALMCWGISVFGLVVSTTFQRKFYLKHALNDDGHMLKLQEVHFDAEGVRIKTDDTEQSFLWSAFQGKEHSERLICLYIDANQAVLVPIRAITSDAHKDELQELIGRNIA